MEIVELELGLHRREAGTYTVELRISRPDSDADTRVSSRFPVSQIDLEAIRRQKFDVEALGRLLAECLFADRKLRTVFAEARAVADAGNAALRLRLFVGPSAPELHLLFWEALRSPDDAAPLFTGERILFSRYLSSADWRPVRRRPKAALRGLIVIANPTDVQTYQPGGRALVSLDVAAELARAKAGLEGVNCVELASGGHATLAGLVQQLRDGCDILYIVCHGALIEGEAWLWLEDATGKTHRLAASELIQQMRELRNVPALVVLASCRSAGSGDDARTSDAGALAALGPGLAEAGIPAVLAMQGDVAIATMAEFMPVFFRELQRDGQIDRAVAAARGAVRDRVDWYMPVLFMRLRGGSLWYKPGFEEGAQLANWPAVLRQIQSRHWTPILGPGLTDALLGSRREIAQRWAETFHFPMAPHNREDLPQVAEFLAINQKAEMFPQNELISYLRSDLLARYHDELPEELRAQKADELPADHLARLISTIGSQRRKRLPAEPFAALARLPVPIYVTAAQNDLISDALCDAGKEPRIDFCRWHDGLIRFPTIEPDFRPDPQHPLVYHLFGSLHLPESLVFTEDNYFDFLIGMKKNKDFIPAVVKRALADTGLVFLGFQLDDWNFRVMFRAIMDQEGGRGRRSRYAHVAAQIDPEEGRILEPRGARAYLESYFTESAISIYWGSPDDFACDLLKRWEAAAV
ncbi:CHAT domain-containing protein [Bradyrhizobium yuanmingense]|uniref:CHAT domain-containing protein n=1 Tax=Bradyrhizobium yuanmingense TaxID=108015 RepID=UPI0023BA017F|nr:CHAT domain-containing protein [Bradyrhizobium yuanmingense]MDF0495332.1 CHAT domain-containing protein [Bradyrhizobium yuanmingense]